MSPIQTELLALIEKMDETKQRQLLDVARQLAYNSQKTIEHSKENKDDVYLCAIEEQIHHKKGFADPS